MWRLQRNMPDIPSWRQRLDDLSNASERALESYLEMRGERVKALESRLASLGPANVLARGYAMVQRQDNGDLVTSVSQVAEGDDLHISVKDGGFPARALPTGHKAKP